ncbi:hypothetical protein GCM10027452_01950 [Micromonospora halotolerans]
MMAKMASLNATARLVSDRVPRSISGPLTRRAYPRPAPVGRRRGSSKGLTALCLVASPAPGIAGTAYGYADTARPETH